MLVFVCTFLLNVKWFVEFSVRNVYILLNVNEIQMSVYGFSFFVLELVLHPASTDWVIVAKQEV